jgi:hypothetical protein
MWVEIDNYESVPVCSLSSMMQLCLMWHNLTVDLPVKCHLLTKVHNVLKFVP